MVLVGNLGGTFGPDLPQACIVIISDMEETKKHSWVGAITVDTNRHKVTSDACLHNIPLPSANTDFALCVLFVFIGLLSELSNAMQRYFWPSWIDG